MRAVIQRVTQASVSVDNQVESAIEGGLLILLGIEADDNEHDIEWMVNKISRMRIFSDKEGKMNLSIGETEGQMLVISQFTLHASTKKGNRPSFIRAAKPGLATMLYEKFLNTLITVSGLEIKSGVFGAHMQVELVNDGPVTIIIDSKNRE